MIRSLLERIRRSPNALTKEQHDELQMIEEKLIVARAQATLDRLDEADREQRTLWYVKARPPREECVRGVLAAMSLAAGEVGVAMPSLMWFTDASERERDYMQKWGPADFGGFSVLPPVRHTHIGGICWPKRSPPTIGIHVRQPFLKMLVVVGHEIAHLGADDSELAARRFERQWLKRLPQTQPEWIAARDAHLAEEIAFLEQEINA